MKRWAPPRDWPATRSASGLKQRHLHRHQQQRHAQLNMQPAYRRPIPGGTKSLAERRPFEPKIKHPTASTDSQNCLTIPPADRTTKSARRTTATLAGRTMNAAQTKQHPQRHRQRGAYRRWLGAHQPDIDQRRHPARDQRKAITNQMGGKKNCSARSTAQNKMATIATCSPEIAIRCAMPVFSISVRKACSSAVRSPNASASNTAL